MNEKKAIGNIIADLIVGVLWDPKTVSAEGDTELHHVKVWKADGCVRVEIRRVRNG